MFFLHLLVYKTICFFIPANFFLCIFCFCKLARHCNLTLTKGADIIIIPVVFFSFIFYRCFLSLSIPCPWFLLHGKFPLFPVLSQLPGFPVRIHGKHKIDAAVRSFVVVFVNRNLCRFQGGMIIREGFVQFVFIF